MRIFFTLVGLAAYYGHAVKLQHDGETDSLAQVDNEQVAPINVIDNSRAGNPAAPPPQAYAQAPAPCAAPCGGCGGGFSGGCGGCYA